MTQMRREIEEIPVAVERFLKHSTADVDRIGSRLRQLDPQVIVTIARGSSDHVATFFKYAAEIASGRPVASLGPSIASVYDTQLRLTGQASIAISQSGKSPDIVALQSTVRRGGAETIAIGNVADSPLLTEAALPLCIEAGPELSVAATKSFVSSAVAALAIVASWRQDEGLRHALERLPGQLDNALRCEWGMALETCRSAKSLFTVGRGPTFGIAGEAALKLKETAVLHAEAFSGAEVMHGPVSLVERGFPVIAFVGSAAGRSGLADILRRADDTGASLYVVGDADHGTRLPYVDTGHPMTAALTMLVSFYAFAERLSRARGMDPDEPRGLKKVTETV